MKPKADPSPRLCDWGLLSDPISKLRMCEVLMQLPGREDFSSGISGKYRNVDTTYGQKKSFKAARTEMPRSRTSPKQTIMKRFLRRVEGLANSSENQGLKVNLVHTRDTILRQQ